MSTWKPTEVVLLTLGSADVEALLRTKYPLLSSAPHFDLLVAGGPERVPLLCRISSSERIPSASHLHVALRRDSVVYIKPSVDILQVIQYGAVIYE